MPWSENSPLLSQFRGLEFFKNFDKNPIATSSLVVDLFKELNINGESVSKTIHENWKNILPEKFLGKVDVYDVGTTVLYLRAESPLVSQEFLFGQKSFLTKIQSLSGCSKIRKIRFV